jgi:cation transport regulator ChaB
VEQGDAAEREERLREARNELRTAELQWEGLRLELDQRCLSNYQQVRSRILATKPPLFEELSSDLRRTSEPRTWWEEGLPLSMRQQLIAASQMAQELVTEALARDFDWLRDEVKGSFGTDMEDSNLKKADELSIDANLRQLPHDELERWRTLTKFGVSVTEMVNRLSGLAASAISVAIRTSGGAKGSTPTQSSEASGKAAPTQMSQTAGKPVSTPQSQVLGMDPLAQLIQAVLKGGAEYGSDYMREILNTKVDEQRKTIMRKLERTLDLAYEEYCERVFERMRLIYDQLSEDTKRKQVAWRSAQITALEGDDGAPDERTWDQLTDESSALRKEILVALGR